MAISRVNRVPAFVAAGFLMGVLAAPAAAFAQRGGADQPWAYPRDSREMTASLRVSIDPDDAEVYVDGYFAGYVEEFDGLFQRLRLTPGPHEIVLWRQGYQTERHNLYFQHDRTERLRGRMVRLRAGQVSGPRPGRFGSGQPPWIGGPGGRYGDPRYDRNDRLRFGTLSLNLPIADAQIFVNGSRRSWQRRAGNRFLLDLEPGRHRIEIRRAGYVPFWREVVVRPGATITLNVSLRRG